jgi:hypothetical protein
MRTPLGVPDRSNIRRSRLEKNEEVLPPVRKWAGTAEEPRRQRDPYGSQIFHPPGTNGRFLREWGIR